MTGAGDNRGMVQPLTTQETTKTVRPHSVRVRVSDAELEYLRQEAARTERSIGGILRLALRQYVEEAKS